MDVFGMKPLREHGLSANCPISASSSETRPNRAQRSAGVVRYTLKRLAGLKRRALWSTRWTSVEAGGDAVMDFPAPRRERLQAMMRKRDIPISLFYNPANIRYGTGVDVMDV